MFNSEQKKIFWAHREKTGGKFANIEHGGTCFCCGARARFVARYFHEKTNSYIDLGERCSFKLEEGESDAFHTLRRSIANARAAQAGKRKAKALLTDLGLVPAWELYEAKRYSDVREESTILNIVGKVVQYGNLSEKQAKLIQDLLHYLSNKERINAERKAQREAEKAAAALCPTGRVKVVGTVLSAKPRETLYGVDVKVLVKDDSGFTVWGNLPSDISDLIEWVNDGDFYDRQPRLKTKLPRVEFVATITPSPEDTKFGFFKNPRKAKHLCN
ncbi:MAG: hypothetical protein ACRC9R_08505 [Enterovibrio sp.]